MCSGSVISAQSTELRAKLLALSGLYSYGPTPVQCLFTYMSYTSNFGACSTREWP